MGVLCDLGRLERDRDLLGELDREYRRDGGDVCGDLLVGAERTEIMSDERAVWSEYDAAAACVAQRGGTGAEGERLPALISGRCLEEINADPEAFAARVRATAYAIARERGRS